VAEEKNPRRPPYLCHFSRVDVPRSLFETLYSGPTMSLAPFVTAPEGRSSRVFRSFRFVAKSWAFFPPKVTSVLPPPPKGLFRLPVTTLLCRSSAPPFGPPPVQGGRCPPLFALCIPLNTPAPYSVVEVDWR